MTEMNCTFNLQGKSNEQVLGGSGNDRQEVVIETRNTSKDAYIARLEAELRKLREDRGRGTSSRSAMEFESRQRTRDYRESGVVSMQPLFQVGLQVCCLSSRCRMLLELRFDGDYCLEGEVLHLCLESCLQDGYAAGTSRERKGRQRGENWKVVERHPENRHDVR